ncbi:Lateral signaling target protein 2 [Balamuthia mandrillaris]
MQQAGNGGTAQQPAQQQQQQQLPEKKGQVGWGWLNPLHAAVWASDLPRLTEQLARCLKRKEERSMLDAEEDGYTALGLAVLKGEVEMVRVLLEACASLTPVTVVPPHIFIACAKGYTPMVKLLLEYGADAEKEDSEQGCGPIHVAADKGHTDIIDLLLERLPSLLHKTSSKGDMTALHHAAACGHLHTVRRLLELGADPNAANRPGNTPLIMAASSGHEEVVSLLIEKGADVNKHCHRDGFTALHSAACFGYPAIAKRLLSAGAELNATFDPFLHTPLHLASAKGQLEMVQLLLDYGAEVNAKNKPGSTPLRLAASYEKELEDKSRFRATVEALLRRGAEINARNDQGNTALHALVSKFPFTANPKDREKEKESSLANIAFLLERGAAVNLANKDGRTCIDLAMEVAAASPSSSSTCSTLLALLKDKGHFVPVDSPSSSSSPLSSLASLSISTSSSLKDQTTPPSSSASSTSSSLTASSSWGSYLFPSLSGSPPVPPTATETTASHPPPGGVVVQPWMDDSLVDECLKCRVPFTMFRRRHHCRNCGQIFCGECMTNRAALPTYEGYVRVCDHCFKSITASNVFASSSAS